LKGRKGKNEICYLQIPHLVYTAEFVIRKTDSLTPLHILILKTLSENTNLKKLVNEPIISPHLLQETLADLLYKNLISLNLQKGIASLSKEAKDATHDEQKLDELRSKMAPEAKSISFIQDRTNGLILGYDKAVHYTRYPGTGETCINLPKIVSDEIVSVEEMSPDTIIKALSSELYRVAGREDFELDSVEKVQNIKLICVNRTMYIPTEIVESTDGNEIYVPRANLPRQLLTEWRTRINTDNALSKIEAEIKESSIRTASPHIYCDPLLSLLSRLEMDLKRSRRNRIILLKDELKEVIEEYYDRIRADFVSIKETNVKIGGGKDQLKTLEIIAKSAKDILFISSAFLSMNNIQEIALLLKEANGRGVQIGLVWGMMGNEEEIDDINLTQNGYIKSLSQEGVDSELTKLYTTRRPSHAKYVFSDAYTLAIGSCNYLSINPNSEEIEATGIVKGGQLPIEFISYIQDNVKLDEQIKNKLKLVKKKANARLRKEKPTLLLGTKGAKKELDKLISMLEELVDAEWDNNVRFEPIKKQIKQTYQRTKGLKKKLQTATLITNTQHRDALIDSFDLAERELIITSDKLSNKAIGPVFMGLLEETLRNGVKVSIYWGRKGLKETEVAQSQKIVKPLIPKIGTNFITNEEPVGNHSKMILIDNRRTLIGSYNFLSMGGMDIKGKIAPQELGLFLFSKKASDLVKETIPWEIRLDKTHKSLEKIRKLEKGEWTLPDHWDETIHKKLLRENTNVIHGAKVAKIAQMVLGVAIKRTPFKTLDGLITSSPLLSKNWRRDGNKIIKKDSGV